MRVKACVLKRTRLAFAVDEFRKSLSVSYKGLMLREVTGMSRQGKGPTPPNPAVPGAVAQQAQQYLNKTLWPDATQTTRPVAEGKKVESWKESVMNSLSVAPS
ncbi:hypothetical protein CEXT_603481 [Caerostris extrusa]|uniref:Uncharacterized protein n=1 Tax=Caerostris extrusa TaxID=172846 RepID=A0AAV4PWB9_CAEEX|nr:hypothetical protein CEXT_603481 [Caerostris extrusa]